MKLPFLYKIIYKFNTIKIKITHYFLRIQQDITQIYMKSEVPKIVKVMMRKNKRTYMYFLPILQY